MGIDIVIIIKLVAVIAVLLALVLLKMKPHTALLISSALLILLYGKGLQGFADAFMLFIKDKNTWQLPCTVILIAILGGVMGKTKMLQKMIRHLKPIVRSTKLTIIIAPMLIGLLAVTGGAYVSCPLVEELAQDLNISPSRKAAINLIYRHSLSYAFPLSTSMVVAASLSGINVLKLSAICVPCCALMFILGHFCVMRDIKDVKLPKQSFDDSVNDAKLFLVNFAPILVTLLLAVFCKLPMYLAVPVGIILALIISKLQEETKTDMPIKDLLFKKVNYKMVYVVFAALFFKACVGSVAEISETMKALARTGLPMEVVIILVSVLTAFPTASVQTSAAIMIPILLGIASSEIELALYVCLTTAVSLYSYLFSPVHMCQILTIEYFKTDTKSLFREYRTFIPALGAGLAVWYIAVKMILI